MTSDDSDLVSRVPLFAEVWAKDPAKVEYFKTIDGLVCLGKMVTELRDPHDQKTVDWWSAFEKVCGGLPCLSGG